MPAARRGGSNRDGANPQVPPTNESQQDRPETRETGAAQRAQVVNPRSDANVPLEAQLLPRLRQFALPPGGVPSPQAAHPRARYGALE